MVVSRDRSNELLQIFDEVRRSRGGGKGGGAAAAAPVSQFHQAAQEVTKELTATAEMLENLSKLTQQRNVFDDHSVEVNQVTMMVKDRISNLHQQLVMLGQIKEQNRQWGATQADTHSNTVVTALKTRLFNTNKAFKDILTTRTATMKTANDRRGKFTHEATQGFGSSLFRNADQDQGGAGGEMQLATQDGNVAYYKSRQEGVKMLEEIIGQLGDLFQDFNRIVAEQEEMVMRIDQNTEQAVDDVRKGQEHLLDYLHNISSNRGLIMKIFGVIFVFVVVFGLFVIK
eukprot:TRINITY_DN6637_c0_g1_i3.p2 TRINITY_DN6637_c0_g1~~TRINITY_DN6637_c0_g1_i3.p2  ORF type:complete len:286 (+),score=129.66 TRINITY_DN6637_c0_g1_i3:161-1018(+)